MTNHAPHPTDALPLPEPNTGFGKWEDYTADQLRADRIAVWELAMQSHGAPIHDPAVTTPREVLVGESPVDRIAAPAQEQPKQLKRWLIFREDAFDVFQSNDLQAALSAASVNSAVIDTHTGKLIRVEDLYIKEEQFKIETVVAIPIEDYKFAGKSLEDGYGNTLEHLTSIYPKE